MMDFDFTMLQQIGYIASAILFIYGLKMLSSESSAAKGNMVSSFGMLLAILVTLIDVINPVLMLSAILVGGSIGAIFALRVKMTSIPEMVALFNGFGGLSSYFLAWSEFNNQTEISLVMTLTYLTIFIGGITFSGSLIAFFKLSEVLKNTSEQIIEDTIEKAVHDITDAVVQENDTSISNIKEEPSFMLDFRMKAYKFWKKSFIRTISAFIDAHRAKD